MARAPFFVLWPGVMLGSWSRAGWVGVATAALALTVAELTNLTPGALAIHFCALAFVGALVLVLDRLSGASVLALGERRDRLVGDVALFAPLLFGLYVAGANFTDLPWWIIAGLLGAAAVPAAAAVLRRSALGKWTTASSVWALAWAALTILLHLNLGTFESVREGTEALHLALFIGTWFAGLFASWAAGIRAHFSEISSLNGRSFFTISAGSGLLLVGVFVLQVDRRVLVGLYPPVHLYLGVLGFFLLVTGFEGLWCSAAPHLRAKARATLIGTALCLTLVGAASLPISVRAEPGTRASLGDSPIGSSTLFLLPGDEAVGPTRRIEYEQYLDVRPDIDPPNILLVTVDALRADSLKYAPHARKLAGKSLHFENALAPGSRTAIGMSALMLGRYSASIDWEMWRYWKGRIYAPHEITAKLRKKQGKSFVYTTLPKAPPGEFLAERLKTAGYFTAAVPFAGANQFFRPGAGFERGFDDYADLTGSKWKPPSSGKITKRAIAALKRRKAEPWFLWVHYYDPHESRRKKSTYKKLVKKWDRSLGKLLRYLEKSGQLENTVVAVTSDHGEAFDEHRHSGHASALYNEQIQVPLILHVPGTSPEKVSSSVVSTIDLTASLLALAEANTENIEGVNLLAYRAHSAAFRERPVFSELHRFYSNKTEPTSDLKAVQLGDLKLIKDRLKGSLQLFDLSQDPKEEENLVTARPEAVEELEPLLNDLVARQKPFATP